MKSQKQLPLLSKQAHKFIDKLDGKTQRLLQKAIDKIPKGDIVPYEKNKDYFRLRKGKYRILWRWVSDEQIIVAAIDSRGQIYKRGV